MSQVLALKYRPTAFDKIVGQDAVITTLSSALSQNRLSHAYLFSGLRGSGKTSTARILAKALVCKSGPTNTPCETCEDCQMANENRHIDIIEMDAASSRKIDDIRDLIEHTRYKPSIARFKIFIIDEAHMLTPEAWNALLKTLEEPPEYIKFIFATTSPMKVPATILSRVQHFHFKQISRSDVVKHLEHVLNLENIKYDASALESIARSGSGSLRDTLTLLDQAIIFSKGNITPSSVAEMLGLLDPLKLKEIYETILEKDTKKILSLIKELEIYECETILDGMIEYLKERFFEEDKNFSTMLCERFFKVLVEAQKMLNLNADNSFVLTIVFFKMIEALNIKKVDDLISALEEQKIETAVISKEMPTISATKPISANLSATNTKDDKSKFRLLVEKITDRSAEVGDIFNSCVEFIEFQNNELQLKSSAIGKDREAIRNAYSVIKHFAQEIFGIETKLVVAQIAKTEENTTKEESKIDKNNEKQDNKEHPFVQKAIELFADNNLKDTNDK